MPRPIVLREAEEARLPNIVRPTDWFVRDRLFMFIHWGLYALPAWHEWWLSRKEKSFDDYQRFFDHFDPDLFEPADWARRARAAGMRHVVITTKHHDGFCLWDTDTTDWKVTNAPFGRDLLRLFVDAFRAEGIGIGFYFSLIDWRHPDFTVDIFHPQRNAMNAETLNANRDMDRFRAFMKAQVRELLTRYGPVDNMFYDFGYAKQEYRGLRGKGAADWDSEGLDALTRKLQPDIVINNRLGLLDRPADYYTPEQVLPSKPPTRDGQPVPWCAAFTTSDSWCNRRDLDAWKSPHQLIKILVDTVANGGNLLMNVGPDARGRLSEGAKTALRGYADWMQLHARAIDGCGSSRFMSPVDCRLTQNGDRLYVHVFSWPFRRLVLPDLAGKVAYAQLLCDGSEIEWEELDGKMTAEGEGLQGLDPSPFPSEALTLLLPTRKPPTEVPVIEIFLKSPAEIS